MRFVITLIAVVGLPVFIRHFPLKKSFSKLLLIIYIAVVLFITLGTREAGIETHMAMNPL